MRTLINLLSQLFNFRLKTALSNLENTAINERLDEFLEIEDSSPEVVEYLTLHGTRTVSNDFPELNVFLILKKGVGFARAVPMPYIRAYKVQAWNTSVSSGVQPPKCTSNY